MSEAVRDPTLHAADPAQSAWVAANAGAGKTYTLAARVTRLLLAGAPPEKILCLTFTKAAAAEMAGRLFDQLGTWAMLPDASLTAEIAKIGGNAGTAEDLRKARRLFARALETPGGLKIQTIHAFCQMMLTRFPLEAGVSAGFTVLDERSAADLLAEARRLVFARAASGDVARSAALEYLAAHVSDDGIAKLLDAGLSSDRTKLDAAFALLGGPDADWLKVLRRHHGAKEGDSKAAIAAAAAAAMRQDAQDWRAVANWLAGGGTQDQKRAEKLGAALNAGDDEACYKALCAFLLTQAGTLQKRLASKAVEDRPDFVAMQQRLGAAMEDFEARRKAAHAALLCASALTILHAVRDVYATAKAARGVLDYDDLIDAAEALLARGAPWVLYKLDQGIDHVLIDEAQDTSARQWAIVRHLTGEFFAGASARETARTLFAVGDEKQSIFSFQGADPAQFDIWRRYFSDHAEAARHPFAEVDLQTSRRSSPEILRFVDCLFADPAASAGLTASGRAVSHIAHHREMPGRVEIWPAIQPQAEDERDPWQAMPLDALRAISPPARLADQIADTIAGWLAAGTALAGASRPIAPGDIMILLPRREPFGGEIIRKLKERGIAVAGADRLRLCEQIGVMDLIALGRFVLLPEDDLTCATLLRSPLGGLEEDDLFALAHGRDGSLWGALSRRRGESDRFAAAADFLARMRGRADAVPPYEFYAEALSLRKTALLARLGPETADAIAEFMALALGFERDHTPSLEGFLHWIERGAAEVKRDMNRGGGEVRVMTVHGAKGLEADIVILPDTCAQPRRRTEQGHLLYADGIPLYPLADDAAPPAVLSAKQAADGDTQAEHLRLLYVALTRARKMLVVCGFASKRTARAPTWHALAENAARSLSESAAGGPIALGAPLHTLAPDARAATADAALPGWATDPAPLEPRLPRLIRPSDASDGGEPAPLSPLQARTADGKARGTLAHALLARLPALTQDTRVAAAHAYLRAHAMEEHEAAALIASVIAILDDPAFAPAFAPGSRAEAAIAADLPELAQGARVHGRIDRLAVGNDHILIVDFKTDRAPPASIEDVPEYYAAQMALYRLAAAKIFPGRRIACALLWTEIPLLMPLADTLLDAQTRRISERLTGGGSVPK